MKVKMPQTSIQDTFNRSPNSPPAPAHGKPELVSREERGWSL